MVDEQAKIGYLRLTGFKENSRREMDEAVKRLLSQGPKV